MLYGFFFLIIYKVRILIEIDKYSNIINRCVCDLSLWFNERILMILYYYL